MHRNHLPVSMMFGAIILMFCTLPVQAFTEVRLLQPGDQYPRAEMAAPEKAEDAAYLGIKPDAPFTLYDIKAEVVMVEILNIYCLSCQVQAPLLNELYNLLQRDPETRDSVKMIGFAAGNGPEEVKAFKEEFDIRFPVIPDPRFNMHSAIGRSRTPFLIYVLMTGEKGQGEVAWAHTGVYPDIQGAYKDLKSLKRQAGGTLVEKPKTTPASPDEDSIRGKVDQAVVAAVGDTVDMKPVKVPSGRAVFAGALQRNGSSVPYFAEVVDQTVPCDLCHDARFIYVFDRSGTILGLTPVDLTKYNNEQWDDKDLCKMRSRVMGRSLGEPFVFDPKIDAVTSATITSSVIFDTLARGKRLIEELRSRGLM